MARQHSEHQVCADTERVEGRIRYISEKDRLPVQPTEAGILKGRRAWKHDARTYVVAERGSRSNLQGILASDGAALSEDGRCDSCAGGHSKMAARRRRIRRQLVCAGKSGRRELRRSNCDAGSQEWQACNSPCSRGPSGRRMVRNGLANGEGAMTRTLIGVFLTGACAFCLLAVTDPPPPEFFRVLKGPLPSGPRITPYLRYQAEQAWKQDEARQRAWDGIRDEASLRKVQNDLRQKLLQMIGGLPEEKTDLHAVITGKIPMDGFTIEKVVFQSLPGIYVTALVYVPNNHTSKHPAVLVPAGHAADGKFHYQALSQRLAGRGYVVISWDPVGQGERSQFWDARMQKSRYNLICAEHAVMGNLAYLAGANLARWEVWDGIRAVDYLLTRPEVDAERISITGTSGGGTQTALIAALDERIKVAAPSCYITSLPMRMSNRIFVDPDSDPEQDLVGMISNGVDHPGLLLLMYPRPVLVAAAVLDFFPIEGTRKTFRELERLYTRFGHGDRIALVEGYHSHQYSPENQEAALDFLDHFNRMPVRSSLPPVKELGDESLRCTRTGQVLLDYRDARSLMDVVREYYQEHKSGSTRTLAKEYYGNNY